MRPIIFGILLVPMVVALVVWVGMAWAFWGAWTAGIESTITDYAHYGWTAQWNLAQIAAVIAAALVIVLLASAVIITALLIAAMFAMPVLVNHVASRDFPTLERRRGGTVLGSVWNACVAIGVFVVLWLATLPLWLLGPVVAIWSLVLSAWLNQRLFRYDALSEHASREEMNRIFEEARGKLFLLGLITGALYFIPLLNLIGPVYAALAFIHLCLAELERLRSAERELRAEVRVLRQAEQD